MKLALSCARLALLGGRERDCLRVAGELAALGHDVTVVTSEPPADPSLATSRGPVVFETIAIGGRTNHGRIAAFAAALARWRAHNRVDAVLGFERMPGLDACYVVDPPWPERSEIACLFPRARAYRAFERSVFTRAHPLVFFLARQQAEAYLARYSLPDGCWHVLPPTLGADRKAPDAFYGPRAAVRAELAIPAGVPLLVHVAIFGHQKGTDRAISALSGRPDAVLLIVGLKDPARWQRLARRAGVADRVRFLAYTAAPARLIAAADLMVHPARVETTGNVIVESLLEGVPVIAGGVCGYGEQIAATGSGFVLAEPFDAAELAAALDLALLPDRLDALRAAARAASARLAASPGMAGIARIIADKIECRVAAPTLPTPTQHEPG